MKRTDLFPTLTASGRIESSKRTIIECELENIAVGVRGQSLSRRRCIGVAQRDTGRSSVKRGDVLAVLDLLITKSCSEFRRYRRAEPRPIISSPGSTLEIGKLAVQEFEEGTLKETLEDFEGKILLARSDLERANDRVAWWHRMSGKGIPTRGRGHD